MEEVWLEEERRQRRWQEYCDRMPVCLDCGRPITRDRCLVDYFLEGVVCEDCVDHRLVDVTLLVEDE